MRPTIQRQELSVLLSDDPATQIHDLAEIGLDVIAGDVDENLPDF